MIAYGILALFPGPGAAGTFVNVTPIAIPGGSNLSGGRAAWGDYNNDGFVDLSVGGRLLRNVGNGTFSTAMVGLGDTIWGDYDNDGFLDALDHSSGKLWHNNQGNGFASLTTLAGYPPASQGATWGDFNRDGYLDIYAGGFESYPDAYYSDVIYTNNRNGTFTKTWTQGLDALTTPGRPRPARGVTSADWDQDGDLDVYVSNYRLEPNALWQNNGSGAFTDVAVAKNAVATSPGYYGGHSIGAAWGDFNNDGLLDLFAGHFAHPGQPESRFLMNRGPAAGYAFQDMGTGGVFYQESYGSPTAGDIDNDGDLDLYFATVYAGDHPALFRNDGNFHFTDITSAWGLPTSGLATSQAAFADYNNDGYLDLMTDGKLYKNSGGSNHYLKVRFDGAPARDATAIGTQVRIDLSSLVTNGQTLTRQVEGAVGEGNQNDHTLHFGLGSYMGPLTMQILWPNGATQAVNIPGVDRTITIANSDLGSALRLTINPYSGLVTIQNTSQTAVALDGYQIASASARLAPDAANAPGVGWDSLTDAGRNGWTEVRPTATALSELNISSVMSIGPGEIISLGRAFVPYLLGTNLMGARDAVWGFSMHGPSGSEVVTLPAAVQYAGGLQLQVIKLVGANNVVEGTRAVLINPESVSLNVDGYTVSSASGSLNPAGFNGLAGHGVAGWLSVAASARALSELNLSSMKTFAPGQDQVLGSPFAAGGTNDLTLEWHIAGARSAVETGTVIYVQRLAGDANGDGMVNIFDVNVVSSNWGASSLGGDVNFDGVVNIFDINTISSHWGNTLGGGDVAVPEPSGVALMTMGMLASCAVAARRRARTITRLGGHRPRMHG